eukprot:6293890-Pyramimonas_sp.AAC.1
MCDASAHRGIHRNTRQMLLVTDERLVSSNQMTPVIAGTRNRIRRKPSGHRKLFRQPLATF